MSLLNSQLNFSNGFDAQVLIGTLVSGVQTSNNSAEAVSGYNFGQPASGITTTFTIPSGSVNAPTRFYQAAHIGSSLGSVQVSGNAGVTINGGTAAINIPTGVNVTFYAPSGVNTYYSLV